MLNQDFKEFIHSLNDNQVRYLVVGGYAAVLHGYPRHPKCLDIWIEASAENASRIAKSLEQFGLASLEFSEIDFKTEDQIIQVVFSPGRRAVINTLNSVEFGACFEKRAQKKIDAIPVDIIALEHLRIDKANLWTVTGIGRA